MKTGSLASSVISMSEILQYLELLKSKSYQSSTRKNYYTIWKSFSDFFIRLDSKPCSWEDKIVLFAGYLIQVGKQSSTVRSYISAIKAVLAEGDVHVNEDRVLLKSLIRACRLNNDQVETCLPIHRDLLESITLQIKKIHQKDLYKQVLFKAIFLSAYYALLRIGELTESPHVIKAKDMGVARNKDKMRFILRSSKTHGKGAHP